MLVRILLALTLFLGATFGGIWYLTHGHKAGKDAANPTALEPGPKPEALFYDSIGHAPAGFAGSSAAPNDGNVQVTYTLELELTDKREKAESLIDSLKDRGVDAYYTPLSRSGKVVYRVRHGVYSSRDAAKKAQIALETHKVQAKVVKLQ